MRAFAAKFLLHSKISFLLYSALAGACKKIIGEYKQKGKEAIERGEEKVGLKEQILEKCDKRIAVMQKSESPQWVKEKVISEGQVSKEILEIVCGIQGITIDTAIQILNGTKEIIKEVAMTQEI